MIDDTKPYKTGWKKLPFATAQQQGSEWVLIPMLDPLPDQAHPQKHFRNKNVAAQQKVHDEHYPEYREAKTLEIMTAAILRYLVAGEPRMLGAINYLRCEETGPSGGRVCVGSFSADGLLILGGATDAEDFVTGRALARKL